MAFHSCVLDHLQQLQQLLQSCQSWADGQQHSKGGLEPKAHSVRVDMSSSLQTMDRGSNITT